MKTYKTVIVLTIVFSIGTFILYSCAPTPQQFGTLEGHVTIGPLSPVVRVGEPEPTPSPEVYQGREIVIYLEDGKTEFVRLKLDASGNYRTELPVGVYVVDINHLGIDMSKDLPKVIEIKEGEITRLDIDIDTGIR